MNHTEISVAAAHVAATCRITVEDALMKADELHTMQLAAISTASTQNTETTRKDRIARDSPYWTVAYDDVCRAVDREISQRNEATRLRNIVDRASPNPQRDFVEEANRLLEAKDAEIARLHRMLSGFATDA